MKTIGLAFFSFLLLNCHNGNIKLSQAAKQNIEMQVREAFKGLVKASQLLDSKLYFEYIDSEKFIGLNADGTNFNSIEDLKNIIESGFIAVEKILSLEFTNVAVSVIDQNTAVLVNEYKQSVLLKNGVTHTSQGGGVQVWSKLSGNWKLVSISASEKPIIPESVPQS